jgi:prefoldin subunit 5
MKNQDNNTKTCAFCGKKFYSNNAKRKYCKSSCKSRAYELRKGIETPSFLIGNDYDIVQKEVKTKTANPEHSRLTDQTSEITKHIALLRERKNDLGKQIEDLSNDKGLAIGALGGGGMGFMLASKSNNDFYKVLATVGLGLLGSQIGKESDQQKSERNRQLEILKRNLARVEESIGEYKSQLARIRLKLSGTSKEIEKVETKEVKIPKRKGLIRKDKKNAPFVTASELAEMKFDLYDLTGKFKSFLGKIAKNTFITTFGQPGSGKSTFFVQMADYFTEFGMLLYVTPEEGISPTFKQKLSTQNINNDNIHITSHTTLKDIRKALKTYDYQFCFIDSINMIVDVTTQEFEKLRNDFPDILFAIIMQSTKDGKFKGSNEYAHNSDINIKVEKGVASAIKNRFNALREYEIFDS